MAISKLIFPNWPAPTNVKAFSTTRRGGVSEGPYHSLNLGDHVDDDALLVKSNRDSLPLAAVPCWLQQVHGTRVVRHCPNTVSPPVADGCYSYQSGQVCVVMTADCLPVLLTDNKASFVAAIHCGWKGLADGILEKFIESQQGSNGTLPENMLAWLGPAIGPQAFEVGEEVKAAFTAEPQAFTAKTGNKYLADIFQIASLKLNRLGVDKVYSSNLCTFSAPEDFFSYRRDGITGRMAPLIWGE